MASLSNHVVTATIKTTGETLEYSFSDQEELAKAYQDVEAHLNAYRTLKNLMLDLAMQLIMRSTDNKKEE